MRTQISPSYSGAGSSPLLFADLKTDNPTLPDVFAEYQTRLLQQLEDRFPNGKIAVVYRGYWGEATIVEWMHWAVDWIASHQLTFTSWTVSNTSYALRLDTPET